MLERYPLHALGNERVIAFTKPGSNVGEGQPTAVGARDVGCEQFGVRTRRSDSRLGERRRGGVDRVAEGRECRHPAEPGHVICSLACLSAAARASKSASRSPSRTWSRLCALKLIRWSAIRFSGKL